MVYINSVNLVSFVFIILKGYRVFRSFTKSDRITSISVNESPRQYRYVFLSRKRTAEKICMVENVPPRAIIVSSVYTDLLMVVSTSFGLTYFNSGYVLQVNNMSIIPEKVTLPNWVVDVSKVPSTIVIIWGRASCRKWRILDNKGIFSTSSNNVFGPVVETKGYSFRVLRNLIIVYSRSNRNNVVTFTSIHHITKAIGHVDNIVLIATDNSCWNIVRQDIQPIWLCSGYFFELIEYETSSKSKCQKCF